METKIVRIEKKIEELYSNFIHESDKLISIIKKILKEDKRIEEKIIVDYLKDRVIVKIGSYMKTRKHFFLKKHSVTIIIMTYGRIEIRYFFGDSIFRSNYFTEEFNISQLSIQFPKIIKFLIRRRVNPI